MFFTILLNVLIGFTLLTIIIAFSYFRYLIFEMVNKNELLWKFFYFLIGFLILFIIVYLNIEKILQLYFQKASIGFVLKDVQDYVEICLVLSGYISLYIYLPIILIFISSYCMNSLTIKEVLPFKVLLFLSIYYILILGCLSYYDFFLSSSELLLFKSNLIFDFQPDIYFLIETYKGDLKDLFLIFLGLILIINIFLFNKSIINFSKKIKINLIKRLVFYLVGYLIFLYFFGGENLLNEVLFIFISVLSFELFYFYINFIKVLRRKKIFKINL